MPIDYNIMKSGIYKITSPRGFVYVGQSVNIRDRFFSYRRLSNCSEQKRLYNSFLKHGVENHIFEILEHCGVEQLNAREQHYFELFDVLNRKCGLNIRGAGSRGRHSEATKKKMSLVAKGKKKSKQVRKNMSIAKKANPTNYWLGKKRSAADKEKFRKSHLGMVNSNKPIIQYDLKNNEVARFDGATDASRKLSISRTSIKNNLLGYSKICGKTNRFKYVTD